MKGYAAFLLLLLSVSGCSTPQQQTAEQNPAENGANSLQDENVAIEGTVPEGESNEPSPSPDLAAKADASDVARELDELLDDLGEAESTMK